MRTAVSLVTAEIVVRMDHHEAARLVAFLDSDRNEATRSDLYNQLQKAVQVSRKGEVSV